MKCNPLIVPAVNMLMEETTSKTYGHEFERTVTILEDATSPVTAKYKEKLFDSVIKRGHIDFGDIPESKGNIRNYKGYPNMMETLDIIVNLSTAEKSNAVRYANEVIEAIRNIEALSTTFERGFAAKSEYVMLEYNTYVFTCVEATTTLIYEFVDFIKRPDKPTYVIALKDTKLRANLFYFEQLRSFNNVQKNMQINYRKMLESMIAGGRNNFAGAELVGIATVSVAALAIVPITRELIYHFYSLRANLSKELEIQARFLEMNRTCVEANDAFTEDKRKKILAKQESLRSLLMKLSDVIRVKEVKATKDSKRELDKDNKAFSVNGLRDEISSSPFEVL